MKRIFVTGGAGFIGSHLVEELVKLGHDVTVVDSLSNGKLQNLDAVKDKLNFQKNDVSKLPSFQDDFDVIYHLACFPRSQSFANPKRDVEVNVIGMVNILELAKKNKAKVIFSPTPAYMTPQKFQ